MIRLFEIAADITPISYIYWAVVVKRFEKDGKNKNQYLTIAPYARTLKKVPKLRRLPGTRLA